MSQNNIIFNSGQSYLGGRTRQVDQFSQGMIHQGAENTSRFPGQRHDPNLRVEIPNNNLSQIPVLAPNGSSQPYRGSRSPTVIPPSYAQPQP